LRRCSCWLFPAECSQGREQPSPAGERRGAERLAFSRNRWRRYTPAQSRKFDCRRGQYWFSNNRPNVVSRLRPADCRLWHLIEAEWAPGLLPEYRCAICPRPTLPENGCCPPSSNRWPCVPGPTWQCSESKSYSDSPQRSRITCRFGGAPE
jgi:hypothetical protein